MNVLVIAGDYWHPMEVVKRGIEKMNLESYHLDYVEDAKDIVTKELLEKQNLVIFAKSNVIGSWNQAPMFEDDNSALTIADYRAYVEAGGGLLSVHAGNTGEQSEWHAFVGNRFVTHPPRCDIYVYPTKEHPIAKDVKPFNQIDEHYILTDIPQDADVFLKADSAEGGTQIAGYTRQLGKGRLCVLTPGHTMNVWGEPSFAKLFQNAMDWCGR